MIDDALAERLDDLYGALLLAEADKRIAQALCAAPPRMVSCGGCGEPVVAGGGHARSDKKYCSNRCKQSAFRKRGTA